MNLSVGSLPHGKRNSIADVAGVRVGHCTVNSGDCHTGVTVIMPPVANPFVEKLVAASAVFNGYGKTLGLIQLDELGTLETPIALTNTLNVGRVHDAMVSYMISLCARAGIRLTSVNPIVCECNDSRISNIAQRPIGETELMHAIQSADTEFEQGAVGAGRGTICYGLKGGIGSASRVMEIDNERFTMGVLVQSNYGASGDFRISQLPDGLAPSDQGSIIIVAATDLPLTARQLRRVLRRACVGMVRLGSYFGHGSGEIAVGFTTAGNLDDANPAFVQRRSLREEHMNLPFRAIGESVEEAIILSMLHSKPDTTLNGQTIHSLAEYLQKKEQASNEHA